MEVNVKLEEQFLHADKIIKDGQITEAMQVLYSILDDTPDFGKAHNHLGWIFETKLSNYDKAEEHYKLAIKFSPNYLATYYNYAILLSTLKRYDELKSHLEQALKVKGINRATIQNEYAIMYEAMGQYDEAIKAYKEYIINLFDAKSIDLAEESIKRCKRKKEILNS